MQEIDSQDSNLHSLQSKLDDIGYTLEKHGNAQYPERWSALSGIPRTLGRPSVAARFKCRLRCALLEALPSMENQIQVEASWGHGVQLAFLFVQTSYKVSLLQIDLLRSSRCASGNQTCWKLIPESPVPVRCIFNRISLLVETFYTFPCDHPLLW